MQVCCNYCKLCLKETKAADLITQRPMMTMRRRRRRTENLVRIHLPWNTDSHSMLGNPLKFMQMCYSLVLCWLFDSVYRTADGGHLHHQRLEWSVRSHLTHLRRHFHKFPGVVAEASMKTSLRYSSWLSVRASSSCRLPLIKSQIRAWLSCYVCAIGSHSCQWIL